MGRPANPFLGSWRIVEMEIWDREYIDLVVPGHITFAKDNLGSFQFGTVQGWLDCRREGRGDEERIEFSGRDRTTMTPVMVGGGLCSRELSCTEGYTFTVATTRGSRRSNHRFARDAGAV